MRNSFSVSGSVAGDGASIQDRHEVGGVCAGFVRLLERALWQADEKERMEPLSSVALKLSVDRVDSKIPTRMARPSG